MLYACFERAGHRVYLRLGADTAHVLGAAPWLGGTETGETLPRSALVLVAPVAPSKVVCIGRNYAAHAKELGNAVPQEPLLFLKPPSAVLAPGGTVRLPADSQRVEHEAELGVVIGRRARHVSAAQALDYVFGYTCVSDVTARDIQRKDVQFTRGKGYDTFCPVGPHIETELDVTALDVRAFVNDAVRQDGNTRDMIFKIPELVAYISRVMTLEPGDLIATGTPEGVGPLVHGDTHDVVVQGIGKLTVRVANEEHS
jgi:2-keto-4-pentenoate hydratase/2-oxohepta-3-ene-1,7-dioic acid hydratase in catechol pathway